ncbi:hypothetical protein H696_02164 [Fonticula alba]|uniref:Uncharacterized protein n=1 Tax=Fonticula alba TaxID=691883 RepID=A0A058ZBB6_FONAL|nr:hypothetical protein H696_02164 [Fonticula alba]KCV71213.1 hypothetical protein H696_02164 [Fonticula alba]|eukprot:XP_009494336.1 hypothetical protein H696_02164 [Fonticula alba]
MGRSAKGTKRPSKKEKELKRDGSEVARKGPASLAKKKSAGKKTRAGSKTTAQRVELGHSGPVAQALRAAIDVKTARHISKGIIQGRPTGFAALIDVPEPAAPAAGQQPPASDPSA